MEYKVGGATCNHINCSLSFFWFLSYFCIAHISRAHKRFMKSKGCVQIYNSLCILHLCMEYKPAPSSNQKKTGINLVFIPASILITDRDLLFRNYVRHHLRRSFHHLRHQSCLLRYSSHHRKNYLLPSRHQNLRHASVPQKKDLLCCF